MLNTTVLVSEAIGATSKIKTSSSSTISSLGFSATPIRDLNRGRLQTVAMQEAKIDP